MSKTSQTHLEKRTPRWTHRKAAVVGLGVGALAIGGTYLYNKQKEAADLKTTHASQAAQMATQTNAQNNALAQLQMSNAQQVSSQWQSGMTNQQAQASQIYAMQQQQNQIQLQAQLQAQAQMAAAGMPMGGGAPKK